MSSYPVRPANLDPRELFVNGRAEFPGTPDAICLDTASRDPIPADAKVVVDQQANLHVRRKVDKANRSN
jgi:hypothetical protein